jgi:hypothetical protein
MFSCGPRKGTEMSAPSHTLRRTLLFLVLLIMWAALGTRSGAQQPAEEQAQQPSQESAHEASQPVPPQTPAPQAAAPQTQMHTDAPAPPAQPTELGDPRFAFHRIDNGFVRLDLRTGTVAFCSQQPSGWACVAAAEERAAFDGEIARLQRENAALKNAMLERGVPLPQGSMPGAARPPQTVPPAASAPPASPPKSAEPDQGVREDAELERAMAVMERVWRRLVEMMMNIQRDVQKKG